MSTILESNSRVDDMTDFELLMHQEIACVVRDCERSAKWRGRFCRPCNIVLLCCDEHKKMYEDDIRLGKEDARKNWSVYFIMCTSCGKHLPEKDITWTKI